MKLYVAGVNFNLDLFISTPLTAKQKTQQLINMFPALVDDAKAAMGDDAVVLIVLKEYEFTNTAIPNADKKEYLKKLVEAVKNYKNILLVPGSFAAYEELSLLSGDNKQKRLDKIKENYLKNLDNPSYQKADDIFLEDYSIAKHSVTNNTDGACLQNSTYAITAESKDKHKKSYGYHEYLKLPSDKQAKSIFYVGADNPIKEITVNNKKIKMGLSICREHHFITSKDREIKDNLPPLEVLVSASVTLDEDNLFGAVNVHMDKSSGLSIHINDAHPNASEITEVKAFSYHPYKNKDEFKSLKVEAPVTHFSHELNSQNKTSTQQKGDMEFMKGFLMKKQKTENQKHFKQTAKTPLLLHNEVKGKKVEPKYAGLRAGFLNLHK